MPNAGGLPNRDSCGHTRLEVNSKRLNALANAKWIVFCLVLMNCHEIKEGASLRR